MVRNIYITQLMDAEETVLDRVEKKQLQWFRQVMHMEDE
jgi:hypothetical protein